MSIIRWLKVLQNFKGEVLGPFSPPFILPSSFLGYLVKDFVGQKSDKHSSALEYAQNIAKTGLQYNGFSLMLLEKYIL